MTRTKPDNNSIVLASVSLLLRGEHLQPDSITEALGSSPDKSWVKGETARLKSGATITRKSGFWGIYETNDRGDILSSLRAMLSRITTIENLFSIVEGLEEAEVAIFLAKNFENVESAQIGFIFPEKFLDRRKRPA